MLDTSGREAALAARYDDGPVNRHDRRDRSPERAAIGYTCCGRTLKISFIKERS